MFEVVDSQISQKPVILLKVDGLLKVRKIMDLMDKLYVLDDVQKVYANFDISEEIIERETT